MNSSFEQHLPLLTDPIMNPGKPSALALKCHSPGEGVIKKCSVRNSGTFSFVRHEEGDTCNYPRFGPREINHPERTDAYTGCSVRPEPFLCRGIPIVRY